MNESERIKLYSDALKVFGLEAQVMMAVEEMGELLSALNKFARQRITEKELLSEIVDVHIMVEQLAAMFSKGLAFSEMRDLKLIRLRGLIDLETNEKGMGNGREKF